MPKDPFQQEVEKELTGQGTEPWEIIYFKFYKSKIPVIERAIETAGLMLKRPITRLLLGNDLCRLSSWSQLGQWRSSDIAVLDDKVLPMPASRAAAGIP